jgi:hypothetical protein
MKKGMIWRNLPLNPMESQTMRTTVPRRRALLRTRFTLTTFGVNFSRLVQGGIRP